MISVVYRNPDDMIYEDILVKETSLGSRPGSLRRIQHQRLSGRSTHGRESSSAPGSMRRNKQTAPPGSLSRSEGFPVAGAPPARGSGRRQGSRDSVRGVRIDSVRGGAADIAHRMQAANPAATPPRPAQHPSSDPATGFIPAGAFHPVAAPPTGSLRNSHRSARGSAGRRGDGDGYASQRSRSSQRSRGSQRRRRRQSAPDNSSTTDLAPDKTSTPYGTPVTLRASQRSSQSLGRETAAAADSLPRSSMRAKARREARHQRRNRERAEARERIRSNENLLAHSPQSSRHDYDNPGYAHTEDNDTAAAVGGTRRGEEPVYASTSLQSSGAWQQQQQQQRSYPGTPSTTRSLRQYPSDASEQPPPYTPLAAASVSDLARLQNSSSLLNLAKHVPPPTVPPPPPSRYSAAASAASNAPPSRYSAAASAASNAPPSRYSAAASAASNAPPSRYSATDALPLPPYPTDMYPYVQTTRASIVDTSLPPPPSSVPSTPRPPSQMSYEERRTPPPPPQVPPPKQHWSKRRRPSVRSGTSTSRVARATSSDDSFRDGQGALVSSEPGGASGAGFYYMRGGEVRRT
ncbi:PREDICTED: formin-like protein 20 [Priapulus caudatus]|uniref:Formin-like protein 20 n=1 Tax=Priapulus caudatus TaxID=37621 RepID=A0ABM1DXS0_PRICU|nr:PREDICTED: formin-like protein 20 [Priapulus caudatus]